MSLFEKIVNKNIIPLLQNKSSQNDNNNGNTNNNTITPPNNTSNDLKNTSDTSDNQGGNDDNNLDDEKLMNEISEQIDEIHKIRQEKKFGDFPLTIRDWKNNSLKLNSVLMTLHKMSCYLNSPMIIPLCKPWVYMNVLYVGQNPNTGNIIAVYSECLIS